MNVHVPSPAPKSRPVDQRIAKLAAAAFWSLTHPLNQAYQRHHGKTIAGVFHPANGFSIRQLIEYAEELPTEILASYEAEAKASEPENQSANRDLLQQLLARDEIPAGHPADQWFVLRRRTAASTTAKSDLIIEG